MDAQQPADIAFFKLVNGLGLQLLKALVFGRGFGGVPGPDVFWSQNGVIGEDNGALDHIFQFPHVARPVVINELLKRLRRELARGRAKLGSVSG